MSIQKRGKVKSNETLRPQKHHTNAKPILAIINEICRSDKTKKKRGEIKAKNPEKSTKLWKEDF